MAENKKAVFHIYKIIWTSNVEVINFEKLKQFLNEMKFYPDDQNPNKSIFHDIKFTETNEVNFINGFFVKYFTEAIKTIENPNGSVENSERYPFVYLVNEDIFLFQHKMGYGDKHSISDVRDEFLERILYAFLEIGIKEIDSIKKHQIYNDRKIFLDKFFDKSNTIKKIILEDLNEHIFQETLKSGQYTYFNPIHDESQAVIQTQEKQIEHVKKVEMEAKDGKTLGKVPAARISMASAENIKFLQGETQEKKEFTISNKIDNIEVSMNELPTLIDIFNLINEFYRNYLGNEIIPIKNEIMIEENNEGCQMQSLF